MDVPVTTQPAADTGAESATGGADTVCAWAEEVMIPTYGVGAPEKNPVFLEKRVYQGSSGAVYPHPVIEHVADTAVPQPWTAVFLENRYLKIMILPQLGGRVQMALDKTNGYHFIYHNRVIKPALVGLAGPWLSGGIEFNWPQHHRPSTYQPLQWRIEEGADGSRTVWCAEYEIMFNTKGMHGFRLYPDRAYLEIDVQLSNRTSEPQTFLWWANPAVHVNNDYQSIFPPDVHAVMDHGKRDVSDFPIATGTYYKVNYAPGTDISRYKNIPVPTSYMAYHSDYDFMGCYDHGAEAGMMHVANHHVVPGKKQWTWGTSDFGQAWDRQLTDEDGPYIELMCGAYTDNQPDFSWIMPGEEKRFTQVFMPYKHTGGTKNANRDVVVNLEVRGAEAQIGVYVSRPRTVRVELLLRSEPIYTRTLALDPAAALVETVTALQSNALLRAGGQAAHNILVAQDLTLRVFAVEGEQEERLIEYTPLPDTKPDIPTPATPAQPPAAILSNEELFLNGLHLEQYRHATYAPEPYYEEALRRDPLDSRCNNALGLLLLRRGKFAAAEPYFRTAIRSLTRRNPNPYDGEPHYNLGLSLKFQGRYEEAYAAFYKAAWNAAWQDAAYFELARLAARRNSWEEALDLVTRALERNWRRHQARHLKIALLRRLGRPEAAAAEIDLALSLDRMEFGAIWERNRLDFAQFAAGNPQVYAAIALDYAAAGLWTDAIALLDAYAETGDSSPAHAYYLAYFHTQAGHRPAAQAAFASAATVPVELWFPNRLEDVLVLEAAMRANPQDPHAPYLLGVFWYGHRRYEEAIACWEQARAADDSFPTVHRNLGLAYFNKRHDPEAALAAYTRAFALDPTDARVFYELDQLHKRRNADPAERLQRLEQHADLVTQRDDLSIERIGLLNLLGRHGEAYNLLMARNFHPWEGGEGKATAQYVASLVARAKTHLAAGEPQAAIACLEQAQVYPYNLGEGKLHGAQENHIFYYLGCAYRAQGKTPEAAAAFARASTGLSEPTSAMYYNDQPPDMIFYQGLARAALGKTEEARGIFRKLVEYGAAHLNDDVQMDYFAVSLPDFLVFDDDLHTRNRIHCHYMQGLGLLGLGDTAGATEAFAAVLSLRADHLGAHIHQPLAAQHAAERAAQNTEQDKPKEWQA
jgi:tetratricopeptide (TPR) repeat protein